MSKFKKTARLIFWPLFLSASVGFAIFAYRSGVEGRLNTYARQMTSKDPATASKAWQDFQRLYNTRWEAFHEAIEYIDDDRPIHFRISFSPGRDWNSFYAWPEPLSPSAERSRETCCLTVGDAVFAILYNEPRWMTPFNGDWQEWWGKNRGHYGR